MIITDIKKEKKHLCRVIFDCGREQLLDIDIVSINCLHKDDCISEEKLSELVEQSDYERAKQRALWYLDSRAYTEKALYDKLILAGFEKKASAKVIARLVTLGLLDDRAYAKNYLERCIDANISKREAYHKMLSRGINKDLINELLADTEVDEKSQIKAIIDKKYRLKLENPENIKKIYAALIRKGFSFGAVKEVLKDYGEELLAANDEFSEEF